MTRLPSNASLTGVIVAVGYLVFSDDFVGTKADIAGVFVWAFGIDVGLGSFLEAIKAVKTNWPDEKETFLAHNAVGLMLDCITHH